MISELTSHRREFWCRFKADLPHLHARMSRGNEHSRWLAVGPRPLVISHYVSNGGVGMFIRGPVGEKTWRTREYLFPHRAFLARRLTAPDLRLGAAFLLARSIRIDMADRDNWGDAIRWLGENSPVYEAVFTELQHLGQEPPPPRF